MKKYLILFTILMLCITIVADEYSLEELIQTAWENSYPAELARHDCKTAKSQLRKEWFSLLPNSYLSWNRIYDYETLDYDNSTWSVSHSLALNDPDYFDIITATNINKNKQLALAQQRKSTAFDVLNFYTTVLIIQKEIEIYKQNLELQQNITAQTQIMYDNGKASLLDLQQSRITELDYTISLKTASVALSSARSNLFAFLNINDQGFSFNDIDLVPQDVDVMNPSNYHVKMKKNIVKNSKTWLLQSRLDFLPTLSLSYNLSHNSYDDFANWDEYQRSENYMSLNISFDICRIAAKRESCLQNRYYLDLVKLDLENYKKHLQSNVSILQEELQNIASERELYQQKLTLAEENYRLAQTQYELGTIGLLDLDKVVISLANARLEKNKNFYQYLTKQEELNLILSQPVLGKW